MASTNRLGISEVIEKTGVSILDAYSDFPSKTLNSADLFIIQNLSDADAMLSFDGGTTDHLPVASNSLIVMDLNKHIMDSLLKLSKGTQFAAKRLIAGTGATAGSVWITVFYGIRN